MLPRGTERMIRHRCKAILLAVDYCGTAGEQAARGSCRINASWACMIHTLDVQWISVTYIVDLTRGQ